MDNVFLESSGERDDFLLIPECNVAAFLPVGQSNTVVLDLGIAYYQYFKNTSLNSGVPLVNPNSEVALNLQVKDFRFRVSERFSYQESPVYDIGEEFFNVYNTGSFARYHNRVGVSGSVPFPACIGFTCSRSTSTRRWGGGSTNGKGGYS